MAVAGEGTNCWRQSDCNPSVSKLCGERWQKKGTNNVATAVNVIALINIHPKKSFLFIRNCVNEHVYEWYFNFQSENGTFGVLTDYSCLCSHPSSPFFFFSALASVVLLDTTSVLGELGWKTYPINGVRRTFPFFFVFVRCASTQDTGTSATSPII